MSHPNTIIKVEPAQGEPGTGGIAFDGATFNTPECVYFATRAWVRNAGQGTLELLLSTTLSTGLHHQLVALTISREFAIALGESFSGEFQKKAQQLAGPAVADEAPHFTKDNVQGLHVSLIHYARLRLSTFAGIVDFYEFRPTTENEIEVVPTCRVIAEPRVIASLVVAFVNAQRVNGDG